MVQAGRLPTVWLRHKRTGRMVKRNYHEVARDLVGRFKDWSVVSEAHPDTPDEVVKRAIREDKIAEAWANDPGREKKFGDKARAQEQNRVVVSDQTATVIKKQVDEVDWQAKPWFSLRKYVAEQTGITPKNKEHAIELMGKS